VKKNGVGLRFRYFKFWKIINTREWPTHFFFLGDMMEIGPNWRNERREK
jgi:hypothetical protein